MVGPQGLDRIGHGPRLQRSFCLVRSGDQLKGGLAHLMRPGPPSPVGVHGEIAGNREQPRPGGPVRDRIRVHPCSQQGLLHYVLRTLTIPAGQMQRVTQQRPGVFGVERANQHFVAGCTARPTSACSIWPCHAPINVPGGQLGSVVPRKFRRFVPCTAHLGRPRPHAGARPEQPTPPAATHGSYPRTAPARSNPHRPQQPTPAISTHPHPAATHTSHLYSARHVELPMWAPPAAHTSLSGLRVLLGYTMRT
jgi:hypothetical protein